MARLLHTGPATRRRSPLPVPGRLPIVATYKSQALERTWYGIERAMGFRHRNVLDFVSSNDWTTLSAQSGNMRIGWQGKRRRLICSIPFAIGVTTNAGGASFPGAVGGFGVYTSVNDGTLDSIWDGFAAMCQYESLSDTIFRLSWEMEGGYFAWTAGSTGQVTEWRRAWRRVWRTIKSGTNKAFTINAKSFFNPAGSVGVGFNFWPGSQNIGGSTVPSDTWGLRGDWYKNGTTGDIYEKVDNTTVSGSWVLRPGATYPVVFSQPDDVAKADDGSLLLDGAGNSYCWVDYVGCEGYAQIYDSTNDSPQKVWDNETFGTGLFETPISGRNSRGMKYWGEFAAYHLKTHMIGECGCGNKVDFPGGQSIEVYGHGGPGDNSFHYQKLYDLSQLYSSEIICLWDQPAGDFNCEWSRSERITHLPITGDFRGDKPAVAGKVLELFGYPGTPIEPFDTTNVAPTSINLDWSAAVSAGLVTVTDAANIILKSVTANTPLCQVSANPSGTKRIALTSFFGGDGTGYGVLTPGGVGSADRIDPANYSQLKLRTPIRNSTITSFYAFVMNEVGFLRSQKINVTVQNQTGTYGQTDGVANLTCAADQINLIAIAAPSPTSGLVIPTSLQIKLGTGAAAGQKFRAVLYAKPSATTRGSSPLLISTEATLTSGDITAGVKTIPWTGLIYALTPGTEYWVGVWGNSSCSLGIAAAGTGDTFRGTSTYSSSTDPTGSTTLTDTGSAGIYAVVGYEF